MRQYWQFYWPLALNGLAAVLAVQLQNGTLARYEDAARELAVFALAMSTFGFFNAALNFVPQLTNVYARSSNGRRRSYRFVTTASVMLAMPLSLLAFTAAGPWFLSAAFGIALDVQQQVMAYLAFLVPALLINGQRHFHTGLLIQSRQTGRVTTLNILYMTLLLVLLVAGFLAGLRAVQALMGGLLIASATHALLLWWASGRFYAPPEEPEHDDVRWLELFRFFLPVTTTGVMFALSRPVLYAFVARTPDGLLSIAALRVGFDFTMLFQQAANQFRHFFVTFGLDDLPRKRRFMALIAVGISSMMLAIALTPVGTALLTVGLGVEGDVLNLSRDVILVMTGLPAVIILRNYFHGILMVRRRTGGMALASALRVAAIYLMALVLFELGLLNHWSAAAVTLAGMMVEAGAVLVITARQSARLTQ